jgi:hypothetical protein
MDQQLKHINWESAKNIFFSCRKLKLNSEAVSNRLRSEVKLVKLLAPNLLRDRTKKAKMTTVISDAELSVFNPLSGNIL